MCRPTAIKVWVLGNEKTTTHYYHNQPLGEVNHDDPKCIINPIKPKDPAEK